VGSREGGEAGGGTVGGAAGVVSGGITVVSGRISVGGFGASFTGLKWFLFGEYMSL
jgi:hypothetical protein